MLGYLLRRLITSLLLITIIFVVIFFALRATAGDPARIQAGIYAREDVIEAYKRDFGTDKTPVEQFWRFLSGVPRGDFGTSFRYQTPIVELVAERLPRSLLLGGLSLLIIIILSALLGVLSALWRDSWFDRTVLAIAIFGQSAPVFWIGLMLVLLFAVQLQLLPAVGLSGWRSLVLPIITVVVVELPWQLRVVRSEMVETLVQDFVQTARAYGIRPARTYYIYALRNAAIPWLSVMGVQAGYLLGGIIVVEVVFNYPGLGKLFIDAVASRDYPLVQAIAILSASLFVFLNFLIDIVYTVIDPRIRLQN